MVTLCGLDLAGTPRRSSGIAVISIQYDKAKLLEVTTLYTDDEILDYILSLNPTVVAIDSPLSLPPKGKWFRDVDIEMKKRGYPVLPPRWKSMEMLTLRAIEIKDKLENHGIRVIETHPKSALRSSNCRNVLEALEAAGVEYHITKKLSRDEEDAVIASLVALFYQRGRAVVVKSIDGEIHLLPKLCEEQ
ncbi:DUF429 domain-containing protein [Desulfurococcaceae archaeon MEX13E-LK6-19]|nr:DUF429 domain-containing protein [Desulfurococcaceae archaeon MEX13E-LK6-19]